MFKSEIYKERRRKLHGLMKSGLALFPGNADAAMNYQDNPYHLAQQGNG